MKKTILTCDRCREVIDDSGDFWEVEAGLSRGYSKKETHRAEWCRRCCVEVGFLPEPSNNPDMLKPQDPLPTLESLIREIIREEIGLE